MKAVKSALLGLALLGVAATAHAQNEQFIPMNGYWVGPYAPGGSGIFGGFIDYVNMINARDGGVGGVKLTYEKCETEYNNARGVECYERSEEEGPDRRDAGPSAVDRHHLLADREGHRGQDPDRLGRLRAHRRLRRPRVPVRLPADHELLVAEHRQDQVHRHRRKAGWTSSRARRS